MSQHNGNTGPAPKYLKCTMLVPKYVTQFQCLGTECPDTCCAGWSINVDKETFQQYRRVVQPTLKPLIKEYLVHVDKDSNAKHGKMGLRKTDSRCGLHSSDGLCMIQQHLGEDALSDTCYVYPRSIVQFGERFQQGLTLSCPEAARLALTQDDAFAFSSADFTTRLATTAVIAPVRGLTMEAMDDTHIFLIQLFQTPELSNTERLAATGWVCQQIDNLVAEGRQGDIGTLLHEMRDLVESGRIHSVVAQLSRQQDASITLFSILFATKTPNSKTDTQAEVLDSVRAGLGIGGSMDWDKITDNYVRGNQLLRAEGSPYERLMSHYLLNDLVRETFPWTQGTAMGHYRRLLTRYGILRLMLSGMAASTGKALDEASIVKATYVFCRLYQHNMVFSEQAENLMARSDWTQLDKLYTLLN